MHYINSAIPFLNKNKILKSKMLKYDNKGKLRGSKDILRLGSSNRKLE